MFFALTRGTKLRAGVLNLNGIDVMKLKTLALAAGLAIAGSASAQTVVNAGGASATRATITNVVVGQLCGAAASTTVYRNGTNVTRIICQSTVPGISGTLDFSYDNTTGSYLGIGPVAGNAGQTTARIDRGTCSGTGTETISGKVVAVRSCTGNEATRVRPGIGNVDVEPELFTLNNLPAGAQPPAAGGIGRVEGAFGIGFGIVVSQALYQALQADQGLTVGATTEANRPSLSRAQVLSLATANGGALNTDWTSLFMGAPPAAANAPVTWVRRVAGSGSQATFNAVLLNYVCSARALPPAVLADSTSTYVVQEFGSTGTQLAAIASTTDYRAGFASRENSDATVNWKFVKLDGVFPSKANLLAGKYTWFAEQVLTLRTGASPAETAVFNALLAELGSDATIAAYTPAVREGVVGLPGVATGTPGTGDVTRMRTLGNSCIAPIVIG
jgi:hypothetical protein